MSDAGQQQDRQQAAQRAREQQAPKHDEGVRCAACGEVNPAGAKFCGNCGAALGGSVCPHCAAVMPPDGDICEVCGAWLLEGKCTFCYADIPQGASFCGECGNPVGGITCPKCATVSIFDYCPSCHTPLTEAAAETAEALSGSPAGREFFAAVEENVAVQEEMLALQAEEEAEAREAAPSAEAPAPTQSEDGETEKTLAQLAELAKRRKARNQSAGPDQTPPEDGAAEDRRAAEQREKARKRAEEREVARAKRREERARRLAELQKRFSASNERIKNPPAPPGPLASNQEIRRYFMAIRPPNYAGWLCNAYNVIHQDPMHCTKPTGGGHWVTEIPPNLPIAPEGV